jgi:hypothetical protein
VKGSDYLGDQDAIEYMCRAAARVVIELEHYGVPFTRLENGRIYQRPFGGQSQNFGGDQAARTCPAADRTGHAMLHTLYQQNLRAKTYFFDEFFAVDLLMDDQGCAVGALVLEIETGEPLVIEARTMLIATGGNGRMYRTTSNAMINTGDGMAMALRADCWTWIAYLGGGARGARLHDQRRRRTFYGALCAAGEGSCQSRCGKPVDCDRGAQGTRLWPAKGLCALEVGSFGIRGYQETLARNP